MITKNDTRFDYFKGEEIRKLTDILEGRKTELEGLKLIKRVTKKDGSDFQVFIKNFDIPDRMSFTYESMFGWFKVWYKGEEFHIRRECIDKEVIEEMRKTNPERVISQQFLVDRIIFTPSEFYDQIQKEIKWREDSIKEIEDKLNNFDKICDELYSKLEPVLNYINSIGEGASRFKTIAADTIEHFTKYN